MRRRLVVFVLLALVLVPTASAHGTEPGGAGRHAPRPSRYVLPGDRVFPEGVATQPGRGLFYVSSTTDGTIFRGDLDEPMAEVFLPGGADGRITAVGLKVDRQGRLYVAGGTTGTVFVYDTDDGRLLGRFSNSHPAGGAPGPPPATPPRPTFLNDLVVTPAGDVFVTDSMTPVLYRIPAPAVAAGGDGALEPFVDLADSPIRYQTGFNLNGIVASANGRHLLTVQANTGQLFRVEVATGQIRQVDLGEGTLTGGDGMLLTGRRLSVVRMGVITEVRLNRNLTRGEVLGDLTDPSFASPTTIAEARDRFLVVNSQFARRGPGLVPELPFTVSSIPRP